MFFVVDGTLAVPNSLWGVHCEVFKHLQLFWFLFGPRLGSSNSTNQPGFAKSYYFPKHKKSGSWHLKCCIHPPKHNLKCVSAIRLLTPSKVSKITLARWEENNKRATQWCGQTASTHEREIKLTWVTPSWLLLGEEEKKEAVWKNKNNHLNISKSEPQIWTRASCSDHGWLIKGYYTVCGMDTLLCLLCAVE